MIVTSRWAGACFFLLEGRGGGASECKIILSPHCHSCHYCDPNGCAAPHTFGTELGYASHLQCHIATHLHLPSISTDLLTAACLSAVASAIVCARRALGAVTQSQRVRLWETLTFHGGLFGSGADRTLERTRLRVQSDGRRGAPAQHRTAQLYGTLHSTKG